MKFKGYVYSDSLPDGKEDVDFEFYQNEYLVYQINGKNFNVDISRADWRLGGFDNNMLYITPSETSDHKVLLVHDISILNEFSKSSNQQIVLKAKSLSGKYGKKRKLKFIGIAMIFLVFLFIGLIVSGSGLNSVLVKMVPVEWDIKLGDYAYPSAISSLSPGAAKIENKYVINSMETIKTRLSSSIKNSKFKYSITVVNSPIQNAFALPGGRIVIFSGLLNQANGPDEVAGVLAHEIMHVENRHAMRQILRSIGIIALFNIFLGDIEGAAGVILSAGSELLTLGYSRSMEKEADTEGFKLLAASGIDGQGMISFFEKLAKDEKALKPLELLSTHPMSEKRAAFLADLKKKYKPEKIIPLAINWTKLKNSLK